MLNMACISMSQFPELLVKSSSIVSIPAVVVEVLVLVSSCQLLLNIAVVLQIVLLQKESEIPVEELLAMYKKVG